MLKIASEYIRNERKLLGYKQKEVAAWIGKDRTTYNRKELGGTSFNADEFLTIIYYFTILGPKKKPTEIEINTLLKTILPNLNHKE